MPVVPNNSNGPTLDPGARSIVNTNFDTSNVIKMRGASQQYAHTLDSIISLLSEYCGPFGGYAMIISNENAGVEFEPNVFTRDGIRILSAMEFMSPMERYLKDLVCYIGKRVDDYAKDGTTTSMLLTAGFLKECLENSSDTEVPFSQYLSEMNDAIESIRSVLDKNFVVHIEDLVSAKASDEEKMEMAGKIAFIQGMSSSGGNVELANILDSVFTNTPPELWDFMTFRHHLREDTEKFSMVVDDFDYRLRSVASIPGTLDKNMGTEYEEINPAVLVCREGIIDGSFSHVYIERWIKQLPVTQPVVVVSTIMESTIINIVKEINTTREAKVSLWQYSPDERISSMQLPWELDILNAINDCYSVSGFDTEGVTENNYFQPKSVKWVNGYLYFDFGIYDGKSCIHPYMKDMDHHPWFARTYQALEQNIRLYNSKTEKTSVALGNLYREMMSMLVALRKPVIYLGGPIHDQIANRDVIQDALGASMSSIKHGFVVNGLMTFYSALREVDTNSEVAKKFIEALIKASEQTMGAIFKHTAEPRVVEKYEYMDARYGDGKFTLQEYMENEHIESAYPAIHPVGVYTEFLKRLSEIIVKFSATTNIITTGGVVAKGEK